MFQRDPVRAAEHFLRVARYVFPSPIGDPANFPEVRLWIVGVWHSIRHVHQTSSQRDADSSKQVGKPGIGAKGVPERLYFEVSETIEPLLASLF